MTRLHLSASVVGTRFNPSLLPSKWNGMVLQSGDAGAIAKTGRYKGKPSPHGFATLGLDDANGGLEALVSMLEAMQNDLVANGAEEISVFVTLESKGSANWEVSPGVLARLGKLPASLLVSCP
jgi:hypothetical protein